MAERLVDKPYLRWLASQPCCLCPEDETGRHDETVCGHHLLEGEDVVRGTALMPDDNKAIPVCHAHHSEMHKRGSDLEYLADHGIDGVELAAKLYKQFKGQ